MVWGAFHGVIISATHYLSKLKAFAGFAASKSRGAILVKWALTFYLVLLGWVLFRASDIGSALEILAGMHGLIELPAAGSKTWRYTVMTVAALIYMHLQDSFVIEKGAAFERKPWLFWPALVIAHGLCLMIGEPSNEFIYFQF